MSAIPDTKVSQRGEGSVARLRRTIAVVGLAALGMALVGAWLSMRTSSTHGGNGAATGEASQRLGIAVLASPRAVPAFSFRDEHGAPHTLQEFRGKSVLLNVWATWCAPCRKEMPALDRLQAQLGASTFQVLVLSLDREGVPLVKKFYDEIGIKALPVYVDSTTESMGKLGILGVPTTLLIDREGLEVARYTGPAEWDSADVVAMIRRHLRLGTP